MAPESQPMRGDAPGSSRRRGLSYVAVTAWLSHWAGSRVIQKFRFHLIFAMRFGAIVAVINWLLIESLLLFLQTSPASLLLRKSSSSLLAFLGMIQVIPAFIGFTVTGSVVIYWVLVLAQWSIVGFGVSFFFRLRHWFFNSTIPFWLLFPLTFLPLILTSSGIKYWCGFGLGQPWKWLYYCENEGATFFSVRAFWEDLSVGLVGVILVWQLARCLFGKQELDT